MLKKLSLCAFVFSFFLSSVFACDCDEEKAGVASSWGYHLILDCGSGDIASVRDPKNIENFVVELVDAIDMKRFGEAIIVHFGTNGATGYSLLQLIETSSITGHFVDENGDAYIDIFSCKPFSEETALEVVRKYFNPQKIKSTFLVRQAESN